MEHQTTIGHHELLLEATNQQACTDHVRSFFDKTFLVRYDRIHIPESSIVRATDPDFPARLNRNLAAHRETITRLTARLREEGGANPDQWPSLEQGYITKLLHTIVHLMDGFFGVDSLFYNLIEDSHQVSWQLRERIARQPERYWLVLVRQPFTFYQTDGFRHSPTIRCAETR
ncbi:hypothetical protein GF1_06190 [Desulfolithobacter dissulfuricans]|uniref:Uncharacterized protein n=1 Tax=Desulfolithobacter dissulfuricans TaxID=2795293 RepID=A0A915TYD0_9BACT|nr:hypothetical protein [Desulfolithobacter dissulfuricans]BCO08243.1 hypothetical protein GF1_06190 [Desulfolithobacter dissulfuricans]